MYANTCTKALMHKHRRRSKPLPCRVVLLHKLDYYEIWWGAVMIVCRTELNCLVPRDHLSFFIWISWQTKDKKSGAQNTNLLKQQGYKLEMKGRRETDKWYQQACILCKSSSALNPVLCHSLMSSHLQGSVLTRSQFIVLTKTKRR